ncbi:hypothetical protein J2X76_003659 [Neorhizobium sp. 2083]|uniref:hypothetical protein n=1 Tax=Neorhizobium sp. 2083 TaxID=2817762 RepID=UPI002859D8D3|nr:hypothetical protein [Neorhizobium sp. 2083]MDR6818482.1 hypothetical protein [Neorhizobium sp. 2083]
MMRVTDLEKFSLEQIWRPYQTHKGFETRLEAAPYNLGETARMLQEDNEWSRAVIYRLCGVKPTFPAYIVHPLVDVVKAAIAKGRDA